MLPSYDVIGKARPLFIKAPGYFDFSEDQGPPKNGFKTGLEFLDTSN